MPLDVSIALASYNGAKYIGQQLQSLADQTKPPLEVVVSDDGSTDGTPQVVERFAARAPFPVILLEQKARLGFADNFLAAAQACSGKAIAFCDHDDVWLPEKLATAETAMLSTGCVLFVHQSRV